MANIDVYSLTLPNDNNAYWLKDKSLQDAKGAANGIAELDSTGKVPSSQLPEIPIGGHTIKNSAGTSMTQRENLQFVDATVSDDSTNDITKIENVRIINSESELTNAPDGLYMGSYDDAGDAIEASDVAYSNTTSGMVSTDVQSAIDEIVAMKGANSGLAELDAAGKVPSSQLPSYVDDVIEVADYSHLPITGETGKIYVTLDDNKTYRWSGSAYVEISESLALGETSSTAYAGDKGKANADNITTIQGLIPSGATTSNKLATANDVTPKADKVSSATSGNLAGLNASGNLTDSGVAASEIPALWKSQGEYGVKNLIPYPYSDGMSKEDNGVTYAVNADGSVTAVGTATATSFFRLTMNLVLTPGDYIMTGDMDDGTTYHNTPSAILFNENDNTGLAHWNYGKNTPCNFTIDETNGYTLFNIRIRIASGSTVNQTFYPMIRLASDTDDTYRPYAKTNKQLTDMVDETTTSISGNPISITGLKSNQLAVNPVITFEPIQAGSGDPSPSNVRAISGYDKIEVLSCGKNLFGGVYNESYSLFIPKGTTITVSIKQHENPYTVVNYYDKNGTRIDYFGLVVASATSENRLKRTFTLPDDAYSFKFDTAPCEDMQIEIGTYDSEYVSCNKTTDLSEPLPQTVYGGSLDVRTGIMTITHRIKDMGELTWYYAANNVFYSENDIGAAKKDGITCVCTCYKAVANTSGTSSMTTDKTIALMNSTTNYNRIYVKETSYSDATAFKTAVTGQKLVYELATPIEIQLTPHEISLLKDYAYVSTNGTNIAFGYHNGEIATLGDVSQLGETVNELGDNLNTKINTDIASAVSGVLSQVAKKTTGTVPVSGSITMGVGAGKTVPLGFARVYLLINSTNASRCIYWITTQNTQVGSIDAMINPANLSATLSGGIVTVTNATNYALTYALYEFSI